MSNIIGLDISDASIEAIVLNKKGRGFSVAAYSRFRLSPDIVDDGRILSPDKLKQALVKLFTNAKPRAIKAQKVFLSVPESKTFTRILSLPKSIKDKELREASQHKAEELIPEASDRLKFAIKPLGIKDNMRDVFYTAAEADVIKVMVKVFEDMNIEVVGITTEAFSSFVGLDDNLKKKTTLLLDIGSRTTIASVFDQNTIKDSININIAGHNITKALMEKYNISMSNAQEKKFTTGLVAEGDGEVMLVVQGQLQPLADELKKFIRYYEDAHQQKIEQLVLIGGTSQMRGIDKYFGENLNLPVAIGKAFLEDKEFPKPIAITKYINALGLARLAHSKKVDINFYKQSTGENLSKKFKSLKTAKASDFKYPLIIIAIILILAGIFFTFKAPIINYVNSLIISTKNYIANQLRPDEYIFSRNIIASIDDDQKTPNLIAFDPFEVIETRKGAGTSYQSIIDNIQNKLEGQVLAGINTTYKNDKLYLLPHILSTEIVNTIPIEEDFATNTPVAVTVKYILSSVSKEETKEKMFNSLTEDKKYLADWNVVDLSYEIIERIKDRSGDTKFDDFRLRATLKLNKPQ